MCGGSRSNWTSSKCRKPHRCLSAVMILFASALPIPPIPANPRSSRSTAPLSKPTKTSFNSGSPDRIFYGDPELNDVLVGFDSGAVDLDQDIIQFRIAGSHFFMAHGTP